MNAVEEFFATKEKHANVKREKEQQLWQQWNANGRKPEHLDQLHQAFRPLINAKLREWKAPRVNAAAFAADLDVHAYNAYDSYDPSRGTTLYTHVSNWLPKSHRYNTKQQNFVYMPEAQTRFIGPIRQAHDQLTDELGRVPTNAEITAHVNAQDPKFKLTAKRVETIRSNQKNDLPGSLWTYDPATKASNREQEVLNLINAEITSIFPRQDDRAVFEHIYGINGRATITGTNELAKKLGKSPSQISRIKSSVGAKVKSYL